MFKSMFKKMLVLAMLLPGVGGCIVSGGRGPHGHHGPAVVSPVHLDCIGCRHVFRGGIWVVGD